jgi:hypothetical protein
MRVRQWVLICGLIFLCVGVAEAQNDNENGRNFEANSILEAPTLSAPALAGLAGALAFAGSYVLLKRRRRRGDGPK